MAWPETLPNTIAALALYQDFEVLFRKIELLEDERDARTLIDLIQGSVAREQWKIIEEQQERQRAEREGRRSQGKQPIPRLLRLRVFERDGYACLHCGTQENLSCDHIVPESKGGPTTFENLQTLCRSCNSRKGTS